MSIYDEIRRWLLTGSTGRLDSHSIIQLVLRHNPDEAIDWYTRHGDPLHDPISAILLASEAGFDGAAILKSVIEIGDYNLTMIDNRSELATAILNLLFKSILSFPEAWGPAIN